MKAAFLFSALLCCSIKTIYSQEIFIDNLKISGVIAEYKVALLDAQGEGPSVEADIRIYNNTQSPLSLDFSQSDIYWLYRCNDETYRVDAAAFTFDDKNKIELAPNDTCHFKVLSSLFGGTDIQRLKMEEKKKIYDYSEETLAALATLTIVYEDDLVRFGTAKIKNVDITGYRTVFQTKTIE